MANTKDLMESEDRDVFLASYLTVVLTSMKMYSGSTISVCIVKTFLGLIIEFIKFN